MSHLKTHRGFSVDTHSAHPQGYVDLPLVDRLYHRMETTHDFAEDFEHLQEVLQAARQVLFTRNGKFILIQQVKTPCSRWVLDFTLSTLAFIKGDGPRRMALENYRDLLVFHPKDVIERNADQLIRDHDLTGFFTATPGDILSCWLSREDGLTDLVQSLYLIAGSLPENWHEHSKAL